MTALREPIQPQAGISLGDIARADAACHGPVGLAERRRADGDAAERRSEESREDRVKGERARDPWTRGGEQHRRAGGCAAASLDLLYALRLLAWSDAIEDGERRSFEEWLAA